MTVSPGYFEVFKIPVKRGRAFTERDDGAAPGVVIINEAMARQFWPNGDPLNDRLVIGRGVMREFATEPERQIIGVVGDTRDGGLNSEPGPAMYIPQAQVPDAVNALNVRLTPMAWVVRTQGEPHPLSAADSGAAPRRRPACRSPTSGRWTRSCRARRRAQRFNMWLMTVFGDVGAAARGDRHLRPDGVLGRAAHAGDRHPARARRAGGAGQEHGRLPGHAAGARRRRHRPGGGVRAGALIATFLFGVTARDPLVFVGVPVLLTVVALLAVWLPARRASRVDPIVALRTE